MLATIDFDDEAGLNANEVDDIAVDRNLPTKFESA